MNDIDRLPCLFCGEWFDIDDLHYSDGYCTPDHKARQTRKGKAYWAWKISMGYRPESWKKRAKKAQITRLVNLYETDRERYEILILNRTPIQISQITRRISLKSPRCENRLARE